MAEEFAEAIAKDLDRLPFITVLCEYSLLFSEIDHALENIRQWVAPTKVETPMITGPGASYIIHEPYGVMLLMGAWNYPVFTTVMPIVWAIAAGNCILVKPSELAPHSSNVIKKLVEKYLDPEAIVCIEGGPQVATTLVAQRWDLIFFTGSTAKGKLIARAAAEYMTPTILELGGKSPAIVDESADLQNAALRLAMGRFTNMGQTCVAPDYILLHSAIQDKFLDELTRTVKTFYGEDPKKSPDLGRIINKGHA
jgi:aldehyde dehydrogenase (NAD+)